MLYQNSTNFFTNTVLILNIPKYEIQSVDNYNYKEKKNIFLKNLLIINLFFKN